MKTTNKYLYVKVIQIYNDEKRCWEDAGMYDKDNCNNLSSDFCQLHKTGFTKSRVISRRILKGGILPSRAYIPETPEQIRVAEELKLHEVTVNYAPRVANRPSITDSRSAFNILKNIYNPHTSEYQEQFFILLMNHSAHVLGFSLISSGGGAATTVDVKFIAQRALLCNAYGVILSHNHPSNVLNPSQEDLRLTKRLTEALKILDIHVQDHIILSGDLQNYYSFNDYGRM